MTPLGEDTWKSMAGFSWTSPHVPFSFDDFVLYYFVVLINNAEYDYMVSAVSPPSKLLDLGMGPREPLAQ